MIRLRLLRVLVASTLVLVAGAGPAAAHNVLRSADPAPGSTVAAVPAQIVLTFDDAAIALGTRIEVVGPTGPVQVGEPRLVDTTVSQVVDPHAPAGNYSVRWRVTSVDGHPVSGDFGFTAQSAGSGQAPPVTPAPHPSRPGPPRWVLVALPVLILANLAVLILRRRRRAAGPQ